jgi:hypothetical protein
VFGLFLPLHSKQQAKLWWVKLLYMHQSASALKFPARRLSIHGVNTSINWERFFISQSLSQPRITSPCDTSHWFSNTLTKASSSANKLPCKQDYNVLVSIEY